MLLHIVLFRPRADVSETERQAMFDALRVASTEIPAISRFQVGRRVTHGRAYEKLMIEDYPYAAVIEFETVERLKAYLEDPRHEALGHLFHALLEAGLIYDYDTDIGLAEP
jgi:hypothetical protein